ncbi:hypothetical protein DL96DRAFT_1057651 [Flagelloscypha sp. PMI_526]|nr:hypothetical protein DL96DRAFT_1057651 [Flagelloscypha sp. PMI_526]
MSAVFTIASHSAALQGTSFFHTLTNSSRLVITTVGFLLLWTFSSRPVHDDITLFVSDAAFAAVIFILLEALTTLILFLIRLSYGLIRIPLSLYKWKTRTLWTITGRSFAVVTVIAVFDLWVGLRFARTAGLGSRMLVWWIYVRHALWPSIVKVIPMIWHGAGVTQHYVVPRLLIQLIPTLSSLHETLQQAALSHSAAHAAAVSTIVRHFGRCLDCYSNFSRPIKLFCKQSSRLSPADVQFFYDMIQSL